MSAIQKFAAALARAVHSVARMKSGAVPLTTGASRIASGLLLLAIFGPPAQAATFFPANADDVFNAITSANGNNEDDVIDLGGNVVTLNSNAGGGNNGLPIVQPDGGHSLTILNGTLERNSAGGIPNFRILEVAGDANLSLESVTVRGGRLGEGGRRGGGIQNAGTLTLNHCAVTGNTAGSGGGGIYSLNNGRLKVTSSLFTGNSGQGRGGGALLVFTGVATIVNSTFSGNSATLGAISVDSDNEQVGGSLTLTSSTVVGNSSSRVGGLIASLNGRITLRSSIVSGNTASTRPESAEIWNSIGGSFSSEGYNLIGVNGVANADGFPFSATDRVPSGALASILNPTLANNGGPTFTHALVAGSPAIDGVATGCVDGDTDQRGVPRPQGAACDSGAYEYVAPYVVNSLADTADGTCDAANCTLREAINAANAAAGIPDSIDFNIPGGGTIILGSTLPMISASGGPVTVSGPTAAADTIAISGNNAVRIMETAAGSTLSLNNLTLRNGRAPDGGGGARSDGDPGGSGGAIRSLGTLAINNSRFTGNTAGTGGENGRGGAGGNGGAIQADGALTISDSTFSSNAGGNGGYGQIGGNGGNGGAIQASGALTITRSALFDNKTGDRNGGQDPNVGGGPGVGGRGGAIHASGNGAVTISNSTLARNTVPFGLGGAITTIDGRVLTLTNSTLVDNLADGGGNAVLANITPTFNNTILSGAADLCAGFGTPAAGSNNLATDGSCGTGGLLVGGVATSSAALNLGVLASNGGPTQTIALQAGSVAIDAGDASVCAAAPVSNLDQRGTARPQGTGCDVGALEATFGNLQAIKTASNATIRVGETTTFTLSARNLAATTDTGGSMSDTVPSTLRIDSVTADTAGVVCAAPVGNLVTCTLPPLALNDVANVTIATTALSVGDASNTMTVKTGADFNTDPSNDSSTAPVTVRADDNTPVPFTFPSKTNVLRGSLVLSDPVTLADIDFPTPFSVVGGMASINSDNIADCTRIGDPVAPGDVLRVCHTASANFGTDTVTTITVGTYQTTFTSTTQARDITPAAFQFNDVLPPVEPGSTQESNAILVAGINDSAPFSVTGGFAAVGLGPCTQSSGSVNVGDSLRVCHIAGAFGASNDTTLTIGDEAPLTGVSDSFSSSTRGQDTTPVGFSFPSKLNVPRGSDQLSDPVTLQGIDFPTPFQVVNGKASINGGDCDRINQSVAPGDVLRLCHTASANFSTVTVTTVTVGTFQTSFTSTTTAAPVIDTTPNAFGFASEALISTNSRRTSKAIVITGYAAPTTIRVSAGSLYSIGCKETTITAAPGMISPGQSVCVRHMSSPELGKTVTTTLTVGGVDGTYSTTTNPPDTRPNNFSFPTTTGVAVNSVNTSSPITVGGINTASPISVSAGSFYSIGSGPFVDTPGMVVNGNTVRVRTTASSRRNISVVATLTIGGINGLYRVTTAK